MKLIECYIENFGSLSDFSLTFSEGLNTLCKKNGFGKTTLSVFIKSMFYGLSDTRKQKLSENDRKHYLPWGGGRCGGYIVFEACGKHFRIERTFGQKAQDDTFAIYDVESGNKTDRFTERIGEELFEIDADGFLRTIFLSEENLSGKNENKTVSAKLSDLSLAVDDIGVMDDAIELLEKKRKMYHKQGGKGEIGEIKEKIRGIDSEIAELTLMNERAEKEQLEITEINKILLEFEDKKRLMLEREKASLERRTRAALLSEYKKMAEHLKDEKEKLSHIEEFFKEADTTLEELDGYKLEEVRMKAHLSSIDIPREYNETVKIPEVFSDADAEERIERAKNLISECESADAEIEREFARLEKLKKQKSEIFGGLCPSDEEVNEYIRAFSPDDKKRFGKGSITLIIGLLLTALGIGLGFVNTILFAVAIIGCVVALFGLVLSGSEINDSSREMKLKAIMFLKPILGKAPSENDILPALYEVKNEIKTFRGCEEEIEKTDAALKELKERRSLAYAEAAETARYFSESDVIPNDVKGALRLAYKKQQDFKFYKERKKEISLGQKAAEEKAEELRQRIQVFASRFPVTTADPLEEIRNKLISRQITRESAKRLERELCEFAKRNRISELKEQDPEEEVYPVYDAEAIEDEINQLKRKKLLIERSVMETSERLEDIEMLTLEKERLTEKEKSYTKELDIIRKTQKYLGEAKDILTAKYLSKTKCAFDKYLDLLSDEKSSDFTLGTSFEVRKNEKGTLRDADAYSKGTRDLYALITRLSLVDSLYEKELPFIILDDPFAYFDDKKLQDALSALKKLARSRQIIYLTSTKART